MREKFEAYIRRTQKQTQPWDLCERSGESYLDLYTQLRWEGWQACATETPAETSKSEPYSYDMPIMRR
jgi:hypothetical protein